LQRRANTTAVKPTFHEFASEWLAARRHEFAPSLPRALLARTPLSG
jgi:hypothetical protein